MCTGEDIVHRRRPPADQLSVKIKPVQEDRQTRSGHKHPRESGQSKLRLSTVRGVDDITIVRMQF